MDCKVCKEVIFYNDERGREPIKLWLEKLDKQYQRIIDNRLARLLLGNYGDHKRISKDILELRFQIGSGYRVYFAEDGEKVVLLLCGGDKKTQVKDIAKAQRLYEDYMRMKNEQNF